MAMVGKQRIPTHRCEETGIGTRLWFAKTRELATRGLFWRPIETPYITNCEVASSIHTQRMQTIRETIPLRSVPHSTCTGLRKLTARATQTYTRSLHFTRYGRKYCFLQNNIKIFTVRIKIGGVLE